MLDETDYRILACLKENARIQWKEIGKAVHMTGQAVSARIEKMSAEGIIKRFTIDLDNNKLGIALLGFITVFLKAGRHDDFIYYVKEEQGILEASRISGDGCYILKFGVKGQMDLNKILDNILLYGNYRLNIQVDKVK